MNVRDVIYEGDPTLASSLVQMLEQEGVEIDWSPPQKPPILPEGTYRWLTGTADVNEVIVSLACTGTGAAVGLPCGSSGNGPSCQGLGGRGPDDGGFLPDELPAVADDKEDG